MRIIDRYSHKNGHEFITKNHSTEIKEIYEIISNIDSTKCKTKISKEITNKGTLLYSPKAFNKRFTELLKQRNWATEKHTRISLKTSSIQKKLHTGFREMDAIKNKLGLEIQFGKYAFMVYDVLSKMVIFSNEKLIDSGIEIVPMNNLQLQMSTGVSGFEQIKTDLEYRGESNIDIPVLILGIDA